MTDLEPAALAGATFDEDAPLATDGTGTYQGGYQDDDGLGGRLRATVAKATRTRPVTVDAAILAAWAEQRSRRATWRVLCLKFCRTMYGLPVVAPSARQFGDMVPAKYRHTGHPSHAPRGALLVYDIGEFGHIAIAIGRTTNDTCLSNDYIETGRIDPAPRTFPRWPVSFRFWTEWTPYGLIDLHTQAWDGHTPTLDAVLATMADQTASPAAYRVACRLKDLGFYTGTPTLGRQKYPRRAVKALQRHLANAGEGTYGPLTHKAIFG